MSMLLMARVGNSRAPQTGRYSRRDGNEDYCQAGDMHRLMGASQKPQHIGNLAGALKTVSRFIQVRQIDHFYKAAPDYGGRVAGLRQSRRDQRQGGVSYIGAGSH